ncbi:hypothetical protein [Phosphitispora sp. TUW77]|uniref:hypothetical protein n=1 Tax=Phosphitispora sp. TUW77 TaxID=3152361 RepID=UPI003AB7EC0B
MFGGEFLEWNILIALAKWSFELGKPLKDWGVCILFLRGVQEGKAVSNFDE